MKKLCVVFRRAPFDGAHGREGIDFALLSASFDQEVSIIFCGEGVLSLLPDQQPTLIGERDYLATLRAFPLYDIEQVLVCQASLAEYGLIRTSLAIPCDLVTVDVISQALADADEVVVY
ncbi:sulfurtransferase complex subunit TusC [Shewanella sp. NIFS-20-20]|uniref:sulfurtransferase complex subunit TusC n=1 Tax=Shewanella sp. NIFS-20-20 TaxID=2853806 RepID=UPI001C470603|nr:sulfurtransferase complex subunit TusC [Shewanella sp. NIFS-20-20]MBV7315675.1 sulfurtransferase complex subunit TusC [Shewanella sp. NIFS-20-20]